MSLISGFEHIVREQEPLAPFTSLKIGGSAEYFAEPTNRDELAELVKRFSAGGLPIRLIGSGSNLLVPDEGVKGLVVHLDAPEFSKIDVAGSRLVAGGGTRLSHFISTAAREGFAGPEQLAGLPGTIGGALHNNTGAHGVDMGSWVQSAEVMTRTGEILRHEKENMSFSYRQSSLTELVILSAEFEFEKESPEVLTKRLQKTWIVRRAKQPTAKQPSAYMFEDVGGESASSLIEQAGLKGTSMGSVELLDSDPNFVVAMAGAKSQDVLNLMEHLKTLVREKLDVELLPSLQVW